MKAIRFARTPALLLTFAAMLAGCSSPSIASIPAPTVQGPSGHQFAVSFLKAPKGLKVHADEFDPGPLALTTNSPDVELFWRETSHSVDVFVYELADTVQQSRVDPILRRFVPTPRGARLTSWRGYPAATESVHCATQAGSCSGVVNVLTVLKNNTIYEVMVNAPTSSVSLAIFNSFRLIT